MPAAAWATSRPVAVEPMNATPLVPGLRAISSPTTGPGPVTRLNTPGGRSASAMHSASATAHTAVDGAGVHTTALPHASAGAISSAGIVYGQFHGLITPTTPRGRRTSITRLPGENEFGSSPPRRFASSAAIRQYSTSSATSSNASARRGLPWSSVSVRARSSRRASIRSPIACILAARSNAVSRAQPSAAPRAASIAR